MQFVTSVVERMAYVSICSPSIRNKGHFRLGKHLYVYKENDILDEARY